MQQESWSGGAVTASFGIATIEDGTISGQQLISLADCAMYEAKRAGKDRIVDVANVSDATRVASGDQGEVKPE